MRNFLWTRWAHSRKSITVPWYVCCRSKDEGGLNIKHLKTLNKSLLYKLVFKLAYEVSFALVFLRTRFFRVGAICEPHIVVLLFELP